jgi:hypothetical protein
MTHVMIDLETWGLRPGDAIRSIGAVAFDPHDPRGGRGTTFYANVTLESCQVNGLKVDPLTVNWWRDQSHEARAALGVDQKPLREVADAFNLWWAQQGGTCVWSHGAAFDLPIWQAASEAVQTAVPWDYRLIRDTRTLYVAAGFDVRTVSPVGTAHNALDDACFQADCVIAAYRMLGKGGAA